MYMYVCANLLVPVCVFAVKSKLKFAKICVCALHINRLIISLSITAIKPNNSNNNNNTNYERQQQQRIQR